ncbi:hypothetical protein ACS0TY_002236 [Phlomoides rotata]
MVNEETYQLRVCDDRHTCASTYKKGGSKGVGSSNTVVDEPSALGTQEDATISAISQPRHTRSLSIFRASNTQEYGSRSAGSLRAATRSARSQKAATRSAGSQPTPTKSLRTKTLARKKLVHNRPPVAEKNVSKN